MERLGEGHARAARLISSCEARHVDREFRRGYRPSRCALNWPRPRGEPMLFGARARTAAQPGADLESRASPRNGLRKFLSDYDLGSLSGDCRFRAW